MELFCSGVKIRLIIISFLNGNKCIGYGTLKAKKKKKNIKYITPSLIP
jgi:hypothetical protein